MQIIRPKSKLQYYVFEILGYVMIINYLDYDWFIYMTQGDEF